MVCFCCEFCYSPLFLLGWLAAAICCQNCETRRPLTGPDIEA